MHLTRLDLTIIAASVNSWLGREVALKVLPEAVASEVRGCM